MMGAFHHFHFGTYNHAHGAGLTEGFTSIFSTEAWESTTKFGLKPNLNAGLETTKETWVTTPEIGQTTKETTKETAEERPLRMKDRLMQLIRQQPDITAAALSAATDIGVDGVNYHLSQLKKAGRLRRIGPTKGGHWQVIDTP